MLARVIARLETSGKYKPVASIIFNSNFLGTYIKEPGYKLISFKPNPKNLLN